MKKLLFNLLLLLMVAIGAVAQQSLPYSYGFEDNDLSVDGWSTVNESSANASDFGIATAAKRTGEYGFRFSSYTNSSTGYNQYLISPELNAASGLVFQFYYAASSSYGTEKIKVGYSTTDNEVSSFTFGSEISTNSTSWILSEEYVFPAGTKYVAIFYYSNYQYRLFVDDLTFANPPTCPKPTVLAYSEVTTRSVHLSWTNGDLETAWQICLNDDEEHLISATTNPFDLTGLNPETAYAVKVRAVCGEDDNSNWSNEVNFTTLPPCPAPTELVFSNITTSYVSMSWTPGESETHWNFQYKKSTIAEWGDDVIALTDPTCYIAGLEPGTTYNVRVQADCESEGTSGTWLTGSFTTLYGIPFVEEFGTTSTPVNWMQRQGLLSDVMGGTALTTGSAWYFGSSNEVFGSHAYINIYGSSRKHWLITPTVVMDANVRLSFDLALTAYSGTDAASGTCDDDKFVVLISTDNGETWTILCRYDNDGNTNEEYDFVYNSIPTAGKNVTIDLSSYASDNIMIAFYGESTVNGNGDNNLHIDNVSIEYIPTCERPTDLAYSNVTDNAATLTWTAGGEEPAWQICVNGDEGNLINVEGTPAYDLSGLTAATTYQVKVRANCGDSNGDSEWTSEIEFTTNLCSAEDMCSITYELTDSYGDGWNGNKIQVKDVETGIILAELANQNLDYQTNVAETNTGSLSVCKDRDLSFEWVSGSYANETSYVIYDINGDVIFSGNGAMTESVSYTVNCTVATCVKPTDLTVSDIASTSATLTWNAGAEETAWQICLDGDEDNLIDVTSASYNITGLDEATTYTAKVRANCGSDYSNWTNAISFTTTMCAVEDMCNISYELHDSFGDGWASDYGDNSAINVVDVATSEVIATWTLENGASGTGTLSVCNGRALQFVWVSGDYDDECSYRVTDVNGDEIFSGLDAMDAPVDYTVNCSLATCVKPTELAVSNIANTSATLTWTAGGEETAWQICIDGDEDNLIDVIEATYTMTELTARQEYSVKVRSNCGEGDFSSWTQPVEFTTSFCSLEDQCQISYELSVPADYAGYGYGWLDAAINVIDAETSDILDTWTVDSGESSATGTLSVCSGRDITFEWVPGYNGGQYDAILTEYTVSDVNGVIFSGTGALDADVDYTVNCSIDYCAAPYQLEADVTNTTADLSWAGNSDNYVVRYRSLTPVLADGFENGIPATWTTIDADADGNNWLAVSEIPTVYTYYASQDLSSWAHNGSDAAASPSYANGSGAFNSDHWLITPQVDLGGIMKFYVTSAYADEYEVLLSTTGTETSDFVTTLKSMDAASISWDEVTIDLSSYAGQQGYIAIHHVFEDGYFLVFDDFGIYTQGEWVEANATGNTLDLVGLTPATLYEYQVLGVCDDPNNDNWSEIASFTTEPNRYAINASAGENGTIYPEGEIVVVEGESQSFEITANDCYKIESVKVDGNIDVTDDVIANDGIYTFTGIDASHSIAATFEQISYTIDVTPGENGTITANDENGNNVNCGEDKSYTIAGNYCYRIANVMVDGDIDVTDDIIANNGIYTFTGVDAAGHSIAATFE
ncbi:MAG: choice-of-anchor J domain-containing protein, partial [Bacteroidales bacterium]|nr:choice-of-anchor J domain-containing protein [Bacteroidales bacterium]